jgi:hypothetical protein
MFVGIPWIWYFEMLAWKSGKITQKPVNKKDENIKFLNNLNKQLLKTQKQKTI